jgi:hypothetical protein
VVEAQPDEDAKELPEVQLAILEQGAAKVKERTYAPAEDI